MNTLDEPAQRIAALFHRKPSTAWSEKEIKRYNWLYEHAYFFGRENLDLIEKYYAFERRKGDKGIHRRDLYTFLNNFSGELDRARAWHKQHYKPKKIDPKPNFPSQPEAEDIENLRRIAKETFQQFKDRFRYGNT